MKNYTVKDISEMLKTDPETVRRWIRSGQLEAVKNSKKEGNIVKENDLYKFLENKPKYIKSAIGASTLMAMTSLVGLTTVTATALFFKILEDKHGDAKDEITPKAIKKFLEIKIKEDKEEVKKKKENIEKINKEIDDQKKQIAEMENALKKINLFIEENK